MKLVYGYAYAPAAHLWVSDTDAADFLQSQFSNQLRPFELGRCTYGLWLDVKGKVIADSMVLCEGAEHFRILSEHCLAARIVQQLEQHIIADDVCIEPLPAGASIALTGVGADAVLQALGIDPPLPGAFVQASGLWVFQGRRSQGPGFELWSDSIQRIADLKAELIEHGVEFIAAERMHLARMAAGIPAVPAEVGDGDLPGEGALVGDAVSLSKGCYLGQEVVARMYNVGRPQRALFRMSGSGNPPLPPLALYNEESKRVGELRSACSTESGWQGVALLKTRYAVAGECLSHAAGSAQVEGRFAALKEEVDSWQRS